MSLTALVSVLQLGIGPAIFVSGVGLGPGRVGLIASLVLCVVAIDLSLGALGLEPGALLAPLEAEP